MRYIALDCESGGITPGVSLLQVYLCILDENFKLIDELELDVKPDDGMYHLTAEGMGVNRINIVDHDKTAKTFKQAKAPLYEFLKRNKPADDRLMPVGHGVAGDIRWVQEVLISQNSWESFVSYRLRDTASDAGLLIDAGIIPASVTGGLESLCIHYGVQNEAPHTGRGDTLATVEVYQAMVADLKSMSLIYKAKQE